jgi:hypothetical protein
MAGRVAQVVENLPSKCEALNSTTQYHQRDKKKRKENTGHLL